MLDDLNRFGMHLLRGSIAIAALTWVLVDEAVDRLFFDRDVSPALLAVDKPRWSIDVDPDRRARVPVEVSLRNRSDLRLRKVTATYSLDDCVVARTGSETCESIFRKTETTNVAIAAGLRGRYDVHLEFPAMARPVGTLRFRMAVRGAKGQADETVRR